MRIRPRNFTIGTAGYLAVRLLWYIRQQMFRYSIRLFRTPIVKFRGLLRHDISHRREITNTWHTDYYYYYLEIEIEKRKNFEQKHSRPSVRLEPNTYSVIMINYK